MFEAERHPEMTEEQRAAVNELAEFYNLLFGQEDDDLDYQADLHDEDEDDEGPCESLLRHAPEIEAGLMPGWKLDRSQPGALLWTTPSGRQYKSTLDGSTYVPYRR
jgi:hypothetical protein